MEIDHARQAQLGPRGGLVMRPSFTVRDGNGNYVWITGDCNQKWTAAHDILFREVLARVSRVPKEGE